MDDAKVIAQIQIRFRSLGATDERLRRQWAAKQSREIGWGGISAVAKAFGMSRTTITVGIRELALPAMERAIEVNRIRRPGGGRKALTQTNPGVRQLLLRFNDY